MEQVGIRILENFEIACRILKFIARNFGLKLPCNQVFVHMFVLALFRNSVLCGAQQGQAVLDCFKTESKTFFVGFSDIERSGPEPV